MTRLARCGAAIGLGVLLAGAAAPQRPALAGMVTDEAGRPLAGATVYVYTAGPRQGTSPFCPSCYADCGKRQVTDGHGRFRIPAVDPGLVFRLLAVRDGYEPAFLAAADPLKGESALELRPTDRSPDPERLITGRIVDPSGAPVVGATVEPLGYRTFEGGDFGSVPGLDPLAISDQRGEFRFRVPEVGAFAYALINARGLAPRVAANLVAGAPRDVQLGLGTVLTGVVRDPAGRGVSGAVVHAVPADQRVETFTHWQEIATDETGRFTLQNVPAQREVTVAVRMDSLRQAGLGTAHLTLMTEGEGSVTGSIDLTATPAAPLAGRLVLKDGKPVPPGTRVVLWRQRTFDTQEAVVGADGAFRFAGIPRGEVLELALAVPGYERATRTVEACGSFPDTAAELRIELAPLDR
jgi:protocatechuate 3,4-dioxygenase beta subunit